MGDKEVERIEQLSTDLKEVYNLAKNKEMSRKEIKEKYGIALKAISDLLYMDEQYMEADGLSEIIRALRENCTIEKVGRKFGIGTNILGFIKNDMDIKGKKRLTRKDLYEEFYKKAQKIWIEITQGKSIEDTSKKMQIDSAVAEDLLYNYSELINRLQNNYRIERSEQELRHYKKKYFLEDSVVDYIKENKRNTHVESVKRAYLKKIGIELEQKGEER